MSRTATRRCDRSKLSVTKVGAKSKVPVMEILFFGRLGEQFGHTVEIDPPGVGWTVAELREALCSRSDLFRGALSNPSVRACVDQVIAREDLPVRQGQEIAFIPPVSGG